MPSKKHHHQNALPALLERHSWALSRSLMYRVSKDAIPAIPSVIGETALMQRGGADHRGSNWLLRILMGLCSTAEMLDQHCCWECKVAWPK